MHTIKLKVSDKIYDKFLWLLSKFSKDEIEILREERTQDNTLAKDYLKKELNEIKSGNAKFITQSEFEKRLDEII